MKWTPIAAIAGIVILEIVALSNGINGVLLGGGMAIIGGLGGYEVKALREKRKEVK